MEEINAHLIFDKDQPEELEKHKALIPKRVSLTEVAYTQGLDLDIPENALVFSFLGDDSSRDFIPMAIQKQWRLVLMPHKDLADAERSFKIENISEQNLEVILDTDPIPVDVLYCNDRIVFRWIKIGQLLSFSKGRQKFSLWREGLSLMQGIFGLKKLRHFPLQVCIDDEVIADTSALGCIAVEHGDNSIISAQLISEQDLNDGLVHVFILSPRSLADIIGYLISSLLSLNSSKKMPEFMGYLKASNVHLKSERSFSYSVDGEELEAKGVKLEVKPRALMLMNPGKLLFEAQGEAQKNSLKLKTLPRIEARKELVSRHLPFLPKAGQEEFKEIFKVLRENAQASSSYLVMMMLSTLIAAFGLYGNSSPVIIGAMILAPLMAPLVSFSMGLIRNDFSLLRVSFRTIFIGTTLAMFAATFVSLIIPLKVLTPEMESRLTPNLLDLGIAVASGVAAAFVHAREEIAKSLAGVAIAVALIPPLAVAGIGLGWMDWNVFSGAFLLYLTNLAGIILFGGLTFWLLGFAPFKMAKRNLILTLVTVLIICIPLTLAYSTIVKEAQITRALEGKQVANITLKDVRPRIKAKNQVTITLRTVAERNASDADLVALKEAIEKQLGLQVKLEITSSAVY
jgi:uncharacterized hydrophobic protein (TIGR00271 family)